MDALVARYADTGIVGMTSIGKSVRGREIYNISVGTKDGSTKITINATHHSNEYINTILVLNQIERVLQMHRDNEEYNGLGVRQLLSKAQIHFIPLVNPDGLEAYIKYTRTGVLEEGFSKSGIHRFNANNVNLNRNYDARFRANVQNSGSYPFSEPETQALRELHNQMAFDYSLAYHSEGNVIFWNYGQTGEFYDETLAVARMLGEQTGYALDMLPAAKSRYIGGIADFGGYKDWLVTNGFAASTIETSSGSMMHFGEVVWSA
ncbi:MAG: M14 family zinc carboxypeptidase [Bacillota bacterium]